MLILPAHFTAAESREAAKQLFASSVEMVEIETFTYCNRTCWFCPNAQIDRRSGNQYMDESLYLRILSELAEIDYAGVITYSRYNEPLADRIIIERIRQARAALPKACLSTHTNGDYLTREYLDELRAAGLNRIFIMTYLPNGHPFDDADIRSRMNTKVRELRLPVQSARETPDVCHYLTLDYDGMDISLEARNYAAIGCDRGKLVSIGPYVRTSWCPVVFQALYIDWNGKVVPCCNIRSDALQHQPYVVDDLSGGRSVFDAYAASPLVEWRRNLFSFGPKLPPCDSCQYDVAEETPEALHLVNSLRRAFIEKKPLGS